ncbi:MAG: TetR family transcriptional regulator C-terminal domain-containing protein [Thioclava marina]|jgi:transcriptional regulator, TetR family|uniref:TetR family transcriptional regulator n=1 Tax=Thioclava marina TaxID=1915077 RepID=A0ABX3MS38_9RHOB|nr:MULTISPECIES: TetR/AcrR family transcriptional regulator [Thioclava]TNE94426.1 MAG: TetR/AcrR family transcriptional regulator [Paracoccaceae bacterium]MBC7146532.1 TetR family transcriptional regulator C-terminal domain-containing protein [Thioclava marina]MBD3804162.1 TetR family transcriptional regulator C-terminal domain-containing protein [Thioclava sp.]OOY13039.1 TetR family transcriptional regulator [Thioclava marina]OOY28753.1 TetR family transcriptional regulator [Thioclava sp. L04
MKDNETGKRTKNGRNTSGSRAEARRATEDAILKAAETVFAEAGFGGATMQLIADMAGLPKANLHYYFETKEALYRRVVERIFNIWLEAADVFDAAAGPAEGIGAYIDAKMEISRRHPNGSKVWASEVMHGAPVIQDYLETTLSDWTEGRATIIRRWIAEGKMADVDPRHLLYMLWATTQHYADFSHQIETLNGGKPLSDAQWEAAKTSVKQIVLRGIGVIET